MTINPVGRDDFAERTCHTARLGRKLVGVAGDKRIMTACAGMTVARPILRLEIGGGAWYT